MCHYLGGLTIFYFRVSLVSPFYSRIMVGSVSNIFTAAYDWWMERASKEHNSEAKIGDQVQGKSGLPFLNRRPIYSIRLVGSVSNVSTAVYNWKEHQKSIITVRMK